MKAVQMMCWRPSRGGRTACTATSNAGSADVVLAAIKGGKDCLLSCDISVKKAQPCGVGVAGIANEKLAAIMENNMRSWRPSCRERRACTDVTLVCRRHSHVMLVLQVLLTRCWRSLRGGRAACKFQCENGTAKGLPDGHGQF
eukprot:380594-Pelagomonas_calceolata.AAC.8